MIEVQKLYPQYMTVTDRRKQAVPVNFERRSGVDRRSDNRVAMDTNLTRDIFEVKNKISQLQKTNPINFAQNISKAASNTVKADQFIKTGKEKPVESINKKDEAPSATALLGGILAITLGGVVASSFLGTAGAVLAVGFGAYFGGKVLKQMVVSHMVDSEKNSKNRR